MYLIIRSRASITHRDDSGLPSNDEDYIECDLPSPSISKANSGRLEAKPSGLQL